MNIHEKLIYVRKTVPYLKKDNKGYQFQYVSSSQTLGSLKEAMDEQGLLLVPRVIGKEVSPHKTKKGGEEYFTELVMEYTWINAENPDETLTVPWYGQGIDSGEKGVGKALTYAEKYFLLKFFNIPTDKDDPDSFQRKSSQSRAVQTVSPEVAQQLQAEAKELGVPDDKVLSFARVSRYEDIPVNMVGALKAKFSDKRSSSR